MPWPLDGSSRSRERSSTASEPGAGGQVRRSADPGTSPLSRHGVPCSRCALLQLVPLAKRANEIPCRDIPLNQEGETLQSLYETATRDEVELKLDQWLRRTIERIERELKDEVFPLESDTSLNVAHA